jgi:hypothetical protein
VVAQLPALAALELCGHPDTVTAAELQRLTGLTYLKVALVHPAEGTTLSHLLEHFGALGNLRILHLLSCQGNASGPPRGSTMAGCPASPY